MCQDTEVQTAKSGPEPTVPPRVENLVHRKICPRLIVFQTDKKKERAPQIGDKVTPLRGVDRKYIQGTEYDETYWKEIRKYNKTGHENQSELESECEESEIDEESDFEMESPDTSERIGTRRSAQTQKVSWIYTLTVRYQPLGTKRKT